MCVFKVLEEAELTPETLLADSEHAHIPVAQVLSRGGVFAASHAPRCGCR